MLTRAAVRAFSTTGLKVVNDVAKQRFVVKMKGEEAVLTYVQTEKKITFISTDVPKVFQGKGVGKILAKYAFDYAQNNDLHVTLDCEFLEKYYEKNKSQYKSLKVEY